MSLSQLFRPANVRMALILTVCLVPLLSHSQEQPASSNGEIPSVREVIGPVQYIPQTDPACAVCGCGETWMPEEACFCDDSCYCGSPIPPWNYYLGGRSGVSYFDVPGESLFGGTYAVDGAVRLWGPVAAFGSFSVNHISGGSQVLGAVGMGRLPSYDGFSFLILFDQFTDSRVEDLYLSQMWLQAGYELNPNLEVGVSYTEPISEDNDALFFDPLVGFNSGSLRTARSYGFYTVGRTGFGLVTGQIGYREDPDTVYLAGGVSAPLSARLSAYANASYEDRGTWGGSMGLSIVLGPKKQCYPCYCPECDTVRGGGLFEFGAVLSYFAVKNGKKGKKAAMKGEARAREWIWLGKLLRENYLPQQFWQATRLDGVGTLVGTNRRGNTTTSGIDDKCLKAIQAFKDSGATKGDAITFCIKGGFASSCPNTDDCLKAIEMVYGP